jgi:hypothetical protein
MVHTWFGYDAHTTTRRKLNKRTCDALGFIFHLINSSQPHFGKLRSIFVLFTMKLHVALLFGLLFGVASGANGNAANNGNTKNNAVSSAAYATACGGSGKKKCKFNSGNLKLEDGASIQITVAEGGRQINCNHKPTSNKGMQSGWYV